MTTTEFTSAEELSLALHPNDMSQVRWSRTDKCKAMKVGESVHLNNSLDEKKTITRTESGWTLTR